MGRHDVDGWCILRTSAARTLPLAASLVEAGVEAWTPARTERRTGRCTKRKLVVEVPIAITPSFVFVRAVHKAELLAICAMPMSPHPAFSLLRMIDRSIPSIADRSLAPLRAVEERFRKSHLKNVRRKLEVGQTVRMKTGGFAGLVGVVEQGSKGKPVINLGGLFGEVEIASYLIDPDVLSAEPQPVMGIAA